MPAISVALPIGAITRREDSEASVAASSSLHEWLESIKPGWAARFIPAFDRIGITELRKLAALQGSDRDVLDDELRIQGARIVQLKQIRSAITALANADKTPEHVTPKFCIPKDFESPMAIYFGDSYPNLFNHVSEQRVGKDITNVMSPGKHLSRVDLFACKSPPSTCAGEELTNTTTISPPSLPFKSPMAAFFDGDDFGDVDFYLSPHKDNASDGSTTASNDDPSLNLSAPAVGTQLISTARSLNERVNAQKSALQRDPSRKASRVTWADDFQKKAALPLVELIDASTSEDSPFALSIWKLSQDPQGTFDVQRVIEESNEDERVNLVSELRGHIYEATQCPHANHVLRKIITTMPSSTLNFIVLELLSVGETGILDVARHRYGCRIIEGLLTHFDKDQIGCLVKCLLADALSLCTHMYGNFVIQRILETPGLHGMERLRETVLANLRLLGTNFYGCAVVGKMLRHSDDAKRLSLARAIINVNGLLAAMGRHRLGKETIELVLAMMHGSDRIAVQAQLAAPLLKVAKRGRIQ
mmetsp:Transcript_28457/g.45704  ORF Transcript_28457/g.45704 Transcript_28457/m.45704 type:complete len:532 (+) Transcript_28457:63-1658(+)